MSLSDLHALKLKQMLLETSMLPTERERTRQLDSFWRNHVHTVESTISIDREYLRRIREDNDKRAEGYLEHMIKSAHYQLAEFLYKEGASAVELVPTGYEDPYTLKWIEHDWADREERRRVRLFVLKVKP
jgi:hypothetical protein